MTVEFNLLSVLVMNDAIRTWDVLYRGQPLSERGWKAHLEILSAYAEGRTPPASEDVAHHEATVALHQDGRVLYCRTCSLMSRPVSSTESFHWCEYRLTDYGRLYASQRLNLKS